MLFPIYGGLKGDKYVLMGKYILSKYGYALKSEFEGISFGFKQKKGYQ